MFGLFKKKESTGTVNIFSAFNTDMHSHILPGIDDGAQNVEQSLALIEVLYKKGVRNFICTPHVYKEMYDNTHQTIKAAYELLMPHVQAKYTDVTIQYAAEYYLDENFDTLLEKNTPMLCFKNKELLIEHGFVDVPPDIMARIFNIQMAGYTPIYAHPERYEFFSANKKSYHKIVDSGCLMQVNLLSLIGYYGKLPMELAAYLVENKLVSYVGSDIHNERHVAAYKTYGSNKIIKQLLDQGVLKNDSLL